MPQQADEPDLQMLVQALDRVFFRRCIAGLGALPHIGRLYLASPHLQETHSRPFGPLQEKASMDQYLGYSKRFLCYCLRVRTLEPAELAIQHALAFTSAQRGQLARLGSRLVQAVAAGYSYDDSDDNEGYKDDDKDDDEEASSSSRLQLEEEVLQTLASFWMQYLPADPFASPLWHFVAVLGINGRTGQLQPAYLFTSTLAGLIYTGRAVVAEAAIPSCKRAVLIDLPEQLNAARESWLCKTSYAPMGYILSLLLYGKRLAMETGSRLAVSWNSDGTLLYFQGQPLAMDTIRQLVARMTAEAEDLLWESLLFRPPSGGGGGGRDGALGLQEARPAGLGAKGRFLIPLAAIRDDLTQTQRGHSFIHTNGLVGREKEMLKSLIAGPLQKEFLDSQGEWKWPRVQRYLQQVKRFQELLLLLVHLTNQPLRGPEITGLRLVNGINRDRSVFIIDGEVVLVSQYHKSLAHFDSPKVIPRMLPSRVGQLMVMYMLYIRPFTDRLESSRLALRDEVYLPSDFIWHQREKPGTPWNSSQLSRALAKWSQHYIGQRITLQQWRHIAIAVSRRHTRARGPQRGYFSPAGQEDGDDDEEEEGEGYEDVEDLAAAHTSRTAAGYGVTIDILKRLTSESLEVFGQASRRWHRFIGCAAEEAAAEAEAEAEASSGGIEGMKRKRDADEEQKGSAKGPRAAAAKARIRPLGLLQTAGSAAAAAAREGTVMALDEQLLLQTLRQALQNKAAEFRSAAQREAIQRAAAKQTPLVAVLPTGAGKSLIFIVPALLTGAGITIIVAPYRALKDQLVSRCQAAGLDCRAWPEAQEFWPTVTVVSAEAAITDSFLQWAAGLSVGGRLDRVVIDECHLTFTAALSYRTKLKGLTRLRGLCCPLVFLTGTLPPHKQAAFEAAMLLQNPIYIRASSHRLNVQFQVYKVRSGRGITEVKQRVAARARTLKAGEKGIIFCCSYISCKAVAKQLNCYYYHGKADASTGEDEAGEAAFLAQREAGYRQWIEGSTQYIVATAALGTGLDVSGIVHVIHLDIPYSILGYAQEVGRAGRAGEPVLAEVIVEERNWPLGNPQQEACWDEERQEIGSLIWTPGCRRYILGRYLDGDYRSCRAISREAALCDNCQQQGEPLALGPALLQAQGQQSSRELAAIEGALEQIDGLALGLGLGKAGRMGCRPCWVLYGAAEARHSWYRCPRLEGGEAEGTEAAATAQGKPCIPSFADAMQFQGGIRYKGGRQGQCLSCFYCHLSQALCLEGYKDQGRSCRYKHIVLPVAFIIFLQPGIRYLVERDIIRRVLRDKIDYQDWLGQRHLQLVGGIEMTNAMAVFSWLIQQQQQL
jgi:superfamily II DNA helicase RecQ